MAIYDCFQFFDEEHILDLRLNILNEFVDFFVMVESTSNHQGNPKMVENRNRRAKLRQRSGKNLAKIRQKSGKNPEPSGKIRQK